MMLKVKRLSTTAMMPAYQTDGAAGLDLHADFGAGGPAHFKHGEWHAISTGIAVEIPVGYFGRVCGRSGLAFRDEVEFYVGTVDSDYRGAMRVLLKPSRTWLTIRHGDRIAQLLVLPVARCEVMEVAELSDTLRGAGGFGSTGK